MKDALVKRLIEARARTRWLLRTVSDEDLGRQHDPKDILLEQRIRPLRWRKR